MRDAGDVMDGETRARFLKYIGADAIRPSALVARMRNLARLRERFPSLAVVLPDDTLVLPMPPEEARVILPHLVEKVVTHCD